MTKNKYILNYMVSRFLPSVLLGILLFSVNAWSQQKRIGYRRDDFISNQWMGIDSIVYDYNTDSLSTATLALKGNTGNGWDNNYKYSYNYDAGNNLVSQIREKANGAGWINDNKYEYTYDAADNVTLIVYYKWLNGAWAPTGQIEYTGYNSYHKFTEEIVRAYSNGNWLNMSYNYRNYYNGQYLLMNDEYSVWSLGAWEKLEKYYYTYLQDSIGTVTKSLPDTNNLWASDSRVVNTYDLTNLTLLKKTNQLYDSNFYDVNRTVYTYNGNGKLALSKYELPAGSSWNTVNRTTYLYNGSNQLVEEFEEVNNGAWENVSRTLYQYTGNNKVEEKHFDGIGSSWSETLRKTFDYDGNNNNIFIQQDNFNGASYEPKQREFFYYNQYPLGVTKYAHKASLELYPNPCLQEVHVNWQSKQSDQLTLQVSDMAGRIRLQVVQPITTGPNTITLNLQNLTPGFYQLSARSSRGEKFGSTSFLKD